MTSTTADTESSSLRRLSSNTGAVLLIYTIARLAAMVFNELALTITGKEGGSGILAEYAGYTAGIILVGLFLKGKVTVRDVFADREKMTPMILLLLLVFRIGALFPAELINDGMKAVTAFFGSSIQEAADQAAGKNREFVLSEILFVGVIGPIVEEIVYRGFVMRRLEQHGRLFAIVTSAVLFGLMHHNPIQLISAGLGGLVLGYAAMRYGIKWSILLHIFNNLVLVTLLQNGLGRFTGADVMEYITTGLTAAGFVIAVIYAVRHRREAREQLSCSDSVPKRDYLLVYLSVPMVIFVLFNIILMAGEFR